MNRIPSWLALAGLLGLMGCTPEDVLRQQGRTLRSTDYVQLAVEEQRKKDAERAEQEKKAAAERESIQRQADKAQAHLDLFEYEPAADAFREAYRLSNDPAYLPKIAEAERRTGDCKEAKDLYAQYLEKVPAAPDAASVKARMEEAKGCETKAGSKIGEVRKYYQKGVTHYDLAEYKEAVAAFKEAYRLSQDSAYLFNIAQSYRMAKNCGEAMRFYQRVLAVDPEAHGGKAKLEARIAEMRACAK
jgi:tetratricopeptide (TPR) repeat protein